MNLVERFGGVAVTELLRRVPVPLAAAAVMGSVLLALAQQDSFDAHQRLAITALAAFLGAVAGQGLSGTVAAAVGAAGAALVAFEAGPLLAMRPLFVGALVLAALVAPAVPGRLDAEAAWRAMVRPATAAALALLGAGLVTAGVYLIELSAEALLGLDWGDVASKLVAPAAFGWLAPIVYLSLAASPRPEPIGEALGLVARTFARLVLTPLLTLYALVLAAYVVRIAALWALPSNEIGWIVPLFGVTGAVTYVAIASLPQRGRAARLFLRAWFPVTIVPVALFVLALAIRVDAYGITPNRYLAMLVAVWLGALALAFTLAPRADMRLVPVTACLLLALGSLGPWSLRPLVMKSMGDRIAAHLPAGDFAAALRSMPPAERDPLCSPVRTAGRARVLGRIERDLGISGEGLAALCRSPWGARGGAETLRVTTAADGFVVGRAFVWGPVSVSFADPQESARSGRAEARLEGTRLVVDAEGRRATFDLEAAATTWRDAHPEAEGGEATAEPLVLDDGGVRVAFTSLALTLAGADRRVEGATFYVAVER